MFQQEKLGFKSVISVKKSLELRQINEQIRRDPLREIMFLIDSSYDLAMTRLGLITDKIAPPTRMPRVSRSRLLRSGVYLPGSCHRVECAEFRSENKMRQHART